MVWMFASITGMTELGPKADLSKRWKDVEEQVDSALPTALMMDRRAELLNSGLYHLERMGRPNGLT